MSAKNKIRGYQHEVRVVKELAKYGFNVRRAWGSDGRAMQESHDVDLVATHDVSNVSHRVQCKKVKRLSKVLLSKPVDAYHFMLKDSIPNSYKYTAIRLGAPDKMYLIKSLPKNLTLPDSCSILAVAGNRTPVYYIRRVKS